MAYDDSHVSLDFLEEYPHDSAEPQDVNTTASELPTTDWGSPAFAEFIRGRSGDEAEKHVAEYNRKREHEFPHLLKSTGSPTGSHSGNQADDDFSGFLRRSGSSVQDPELREAYWDRPGSSSPNPSNSIPGRNDESYVHGDHGPFDKNPHEPEDDLLACSRNGPPGGNDPGDDDPGDAAGGGKDDESEESDDKEKAVKELLLLKAINSKYLPAFADEENVILHDTVLEAELALRKAEEAVEEQDDRAAIMEEHMKRVQQEILFSQSRHEAKRREIATEEHLFKMSTFGTGRLKAEMVKMAKEAEEITNRLRQFRTSIFQANEKMDQFRLLMHWNKVF